MKILLGLIAITMFGGMITAEAFRLNKRRAYKGKPETPHLDALRRKYRGR